MNSYTYNDVSWRVFGEVNNWTVVHHHLKAQEAHQPALKDFLFQAMCLMNYTCKDGIITYTVAETAEGYSFNMDWTSTKIKSETTAAYIEQLKHQQSPETGKTEWRVAIHQAISELLTVCSQLDFSYSAIENTDHTQATLSAFVKFTNLIIPPLNWYLYPEAPKRQLSIFDVFDFGTEIYSSYGNWEKKEPFAMDFETYKNWYLALVFTLHKQQFRINFSDCSLQHENFCSFLQHIINAYYKFPDENNFYNVSKHHHRASFDTGPTILVSDIKPLTNTILFLLRDYPDLEYEDNWFYENMTPYEHFIGYYERKTLANLQAPILLAVEMERRLFIAKVYWAVVKFILHIGFDKYKEFYEEEFPHRLFQKLQLIVMRETPSTWGFWEPNKEQTQDYQPIHFETMSIEGRSSYSPEELKEKFSFLL